MRSCALMRGWLRAGVMGLGVAAWMGAAGCEGTEPCAGHCGPRDAGLRMDVAEVDAGDSSLTGIGDAARGASRERCHLRLRGDRTNGTERLFIAVVRVADEKTVEVTALAAAEGELELTLYGLLERDEEYRVDYFYDHLVTPWMWTHFGCEWDVPADYMTCTPNVDSAHRDLLAVCPSAGERPYAIEHELSFAPFAGSADSDNPSDAFPRPGDLDGNGCVDRVDLDLAHTSWVSGVSVSEPGERVVGDVDFDGTASLFDGALVQMYSTHFPCGGEP